MRLQYFTTTSILTLIIAFLLSMGTIHKTKATVYEYTLGSGGTTEGQLIAALNIACLAGDCTGGEATDDTIKIIIPDGISSSVFPEEFDWDLSDFTYVIIDILGEDGVGSGGGVLTIPKKSEVILSEPSYLAINPTNTDGLIAGNEGNTYIRIGSQDFHGNSFPSIIAAGGASSAGFGTPLPIELLYFTANYNQGEVSLQWATALEENNDYFLIQRSSDGVQFSTIGNLSGAGNSSEKLTYEFIDTAPPSNSIVYYRLTQVDYDGQSESFDIVAVQVEGDQQSGIHIYPNPANQTIQIYSNYIDSESFTYSISSINGGMTITGNASWSEPINIDQLAQGLYKMVINGDLIQKLVIE